MARSRASAKAAGSSFERWLPVVGWEGYYEVSSEGNVRSADRVVNHQHSGYLTLRGRLLTQSVNIHGRKYVRLTRDAKSSSFLVHRLVAFAFVGQPPKADMEVCHNDGDETNNRFENLRWDTHRENMRDMVKHGRNCAGKTECPRGHPLAEPNLVACVKRAGYRECLSCSRARARLRDWGGVGDLKALSDRYYEQIQVGAHG